MLRVLPDAPGLANATSFAVPVATSAPAWSPDGARFAISVQDEGTRVRIYDAASLAVVREVDVVVTKGGNASFQEELGALPVPRYGFLERVDASLATERATPTAPLALLVLAACAAARLSRRG